MMICDLINLIGHLYLQTISFIEIPWPKRGKHDEPHGVDHFRRMTMLAYRWVNNAWSVLTRYDVLNVGAVGHLKQKLSTFLHESVADMFCCKMPVKLIGWFYWKR